VGDSSSPMNSVRGKTEQAHGIVDGIGLYCPVPVLNTRQEMDKLAIGQILEVWADDPAAEEDLKAWAKRCLSHH